MNISLLNAFCVKKSAIELDAFNSFRLTDQSPHIELIRGVRNFI